MIFFIAFRSSISSTVFEKTAKDIKLCCCGHAAQEHRPPFVALSSRPHSTPPLSQSAAAPAAYEPHPPSVGLVSGGTVATDDLGPTVRRGGGDGGMGGQ